MQVTVCVRAALCGIGPNTLASGLAATSSDIASDATQAVRASLAEELGFNSAVAAECLSKMSAQTSGPYVPLSGGVQCVHLE